MTTFPRNCHGSKKIHGSKSARRYRQSLRVRPCQGFAALETKSDDISTQNPRVQKRARLLPEPSRVRPCPGLATLEALPRFATLEAKSGKIHGSKSVSGYHQGFLEYALARVSGPSGLGANSLVCIACWCALLRVGSWFVYVARRVRWCALLDVRW